MKKRSGILLVIVLGLLASARAESDYVKSIEKWRSDEETNLKKETGWLTVAGLFWLKEGINTVGAGPDFDVRLTDNFKKGKFGEIELKNGAATAAPPRPRRKTLRFIPLRVVMVHGPASGRNPPGSDRRAR